MRLSGWVQPALARLRVSLGISVRVPFIPPSLLVLLLLLLLPLELCESWCANR
jgi:hypothetical protein